MQLESDVQATVPYVLILASCHDTAPELLYSFMCVAATQNSDTGMTWAANTSLLKVQLSDVMIETVQPENMLTWRNVSPSSQH